MVAVASTLPEADLRRDGRVESVLRDWNYTDDEITFDPAYPLSKVDSDHSGTQVRNLEHRAPRHRVEEYAVQMRAGAMFPPLVLTSTGRLVDGNTRKKAALTIGEETFPAYLIKLKRSDQGPVIGAALNQTGGERLTAEEAYDAAAKMIKDRHSDDVIARTVGRTPQQVGNYRKRVRYQESAQRVNITDVVIPPSVQEALSQVVHDEPFKAATQLAASAKIPARDVKEIVAKIADARSEREELEVIEEAAQKWRPTGPPPHVSLNKIATQAIRRVESILSAYKEPAELAPAALREDLEPKWRELRDLAEAVLGSFAEQSEPSLGSSE